jgi:trk system potassium uptake protein TrkA
MKILVIGGGAVGKTISRDLVKIKNHEVIIVDFESEADQKNPIPGVRWVSGDACDLKVLENADALDADVLVAATGDDQTNLVVSLIGKTEFGISKTIARINHPKNVSLFDASWGVDLSVSTPAVMTSLIEEAVSIGEAVPIFELTRSGANIMKYTIPPNSIYINMPKNEFKLERDVILCAIVRGNTIIGPDEDVILEAYDELILLAKGLQENI